MSKVVSYHAPTKIQTKVLCTVPALDPLLGAVVELIEDGQELPGPASNNISLFSGWDSFSLESIVDEAVSTPTNTTIFISGYAFDELSQYRCVFLDSSSLQQEFETLALFRSTKLVLKGNIS